ncbi:hypothetical protein LCGC14_0714930 [marine sediment metagenome]|uniref:Uncharacterized protein n=1 Tax=marine sediment metagenome TaxID=412755 RepID=A0A0F9TLJ5_9ZZZZ
MKIKKDSSKGIKLFLKLVNIPIVIFILIIIFLCYAFVKVEELPITNLRLYFLQLLLVILTFFSIMSLMYLSLAIESQEIKLEIIELKKEKDRGTR